MTRTEQSSDRPAPLSLSDLFSQYLREQVAIQVRGLGSLEAACEVVPYDAVPVQPVEPQLAWDDALAVLQYFPAAGAPRSGTVPDDWPALVCDQESAVALAFCLGNFPQLVRNLHPLLNGSDLAALGVAPARPVTASSLLGWVHSSREPAHLLLAAGVLRLARHFDEAEDLLREAAPLPAEWQPVRANEEAALAWHRGRADEALALWEAQPASVPVLFNRGMAALFLGRPGPARAALAEAVAALPETSAWYHLGHLYLALSEARN
jgi:tetratricopeptide (TPR) repeat protein